ncbi:hypothetical protein FW778_09055 [Ginsengibacter hankyongi]|uniref:Uncharacterized protein n=1 Tax=Ginsengibacter hankyongi TaxID=2607284 RepID=A0A5J5ILY7_9BACT|nr:hypothetical protein [Ginsengibacter hankyongi]KAA9042146.1 hypothetical protein FW778_09055 [Ginsengibacter hankyongi]
MANENSTGEKGRGSFWDSTLGTITKVTALLTAITGLILAVKPFLKNNDGGSPGNVTHGTGTDTLKPPPAIDYHSLATDMANAWCSNLKSNNLDELVSNSSVPFYADNKILNSLAEVRDSYSAIAKNFSRPPTRDSMGNVISGAPELVELKIYKLSELKNQGFDVSHDRLFSSLNLEDDPFVGVLGFGNSGRKDYVELVFRKVGSTLKVAGWWD